jgi:hypothetical protein
MQKIRIQWEYLNNKEKILECNYNYVVELIVINSNL